MGKGDQTTKRGKIFRGSHGKTRSRTKEKARSDKGINRANKSKKKK